MSLNPRPQVPFQWLLNGQQAHPAVAIAAIVALVVILVLVFRVAIGGRMR